MYRQTYPLVGSTICRLLSSAHLCEIVNDVVQNADVPVQYYWNGSHFGQGVNNVWWTMVIILDSLWVVDCSAMWNLLICRQSANSRSDEWQYVRAAASINSRISHMLTTCRLDRTFDSLTVRDHHNKDRQGFQFCLYSYGWYNFTSLLHNLCHSCCSFVTIRTSGLLFTACRYPAAQTVTKNYWSKPKQCPCCYIRYPTVLYIYIYDLSNKLVDSGCDCLHLTYEQRI